MNNRFKYSRTIEDKFNEWESRNIDKEQMSFYSLTVPIEYMDDISYAPNSKGIYDTIDNFFSYIFSDTSFLRDTTKRKTRNGEYPYKEVPRKYWGLFYFIMRRLYPPTGSKYKNEIAYKLIKSPESFNAQENEIEFQKSIETFVSDIKAYCREAIVNDEQELFTINKFKETITIKSLSWRRFKTNFIFDNCQKLESYSHFRRLIVQAGFDINEFQIYVLDPKNDNVSIDSEDMRLLLNEWHNVTKEVEDLPEYSQIDQSKYFHEIEFEQILDAVLHHQALHSFYNETVNDYMQILRRLQAIVDLKYISSFLDDKNAEGDRCNSSNDILQQILLNVQKLYDDCLTEFAKLHDDITLTIHEDEALQNKLSKAITNDAVVQAINTDKFLKNDLENKLNITIPNRKSSVSPILAKLKYHYQKKEPN